VACISSIHNLPAFHILPYAVRCEHWHRGHVQSKCLVHKTCGMNKQGCRPTIGVHRLSSMHQRINGDETLRKSSAAVTRRAHAGPEAPLLHARVAAQASRPAARALAPHASAPRASAQRLSAASVAKARRAALRAARRGASRARARSRRRGGQRRSRRGAAPTVARAEPP